MKNNLKKKNDLKNSQKDLRYGQIMGIKVLGTTMPELLARVEHFISCSTKFTIVTPNPELILMAQKDPDLKVALNSADLPVPDGVGLYFAYKFLYNKPLNIIPGRKLFQGLVDLANKQGWKVFLLGGLSDEAKIARQRLQVLYPKLQIQSDKFIQLDQSAEPATEGAIKIQSDIVDQINKFAPQLLFVAFGNPKQEIWIYKNLSRLNVGGAMAVGGTLRYVAGLSPLPPKWMGEIGLEWLWRVVNEPKRLARIFNAVIVFPLKLFWFKTIEE